MALVGKIAGKRLNLIPNIIKAQGKFLRIEWKKFVKFFKSFERAEMKKHKNTRENENSKKFYKKKIVVEEKFKVKKNFVFLY